MTSAGLPSLRRSRRVGHCNRNHDSCDAMGRAISQALEALARQPEAERSITRALFIGLAMIESLAIYCLVIVLIILFRNPLMNTC